MNEAVGGGHIGKRDVGGPDHAGGQHRIIAVGHAQGHAFGDVGCCQFTGVNVEQQEVGEGRHAFFRGEGGQVDARRSKRLVGGRKDRERSIALQRLHQPGLDQRRNERRVHAGASSRGGDVVERIRGGQHPVDDVDDAVAGHHVGRGDGGAVHHDRAVDREGEAAPVDGRCRHAMRDVGRRDGTGHHVGQQDVGQGRPSLIGVKGCQVHAGISKGLVGRGEQRERSFSLKGFQQLRLHHGRHERVVNAGALRRAWKVVGVVGRHEDGVDHMDDAVAGHHVGGGDRCTVHHDGVAHGKRQGSAVGGLSRHAVRHVGGGHGGRNDVGQQDFAQGGHALGRVERGEVNASIGERLVRRGKDRERPLPLQRGQQLGLNDSGHQAVVNARAPCRGGNVPRCIGGHQHLIDDVDDAVAGGHVGGGDRGVVHHDRGAHTEGQGVAVDRRCRHAVRHVAGRHSAAQHVVLEDVREGGLAR